MEGSRVWIPDPEEGWLPARVLSDDIEKLTVQRDVDGEERVVSRKDVVVLHETSLKNLDDMIALPDLHEATLLYNLRQRYDQDIIYTYIGPMIVSVNPFKKLTICGAELIPEYQTKTREDLSPHLFAIAQRAFHNLTELGQSQSIVISGESGAGKTEATKVVLKYLTTVATSINTEKNGTGLAERILATNPVLEAFGNAKTTRNNNSSRFGKFIKIAFDDSGKVIIGARIDNYLLEQTRIIEQAPRERNYHIFYQFVQGSIPEERQKYCISGSPNDYSYLTNGAMEAEGIDDVEDWGNVKSALGSLGISPLEQSEFFSVLSAVLNLGNVTFIGDDTVQLPQITFNVEL